MDWYYYRDNEEVGPFSPTDFQQLFNDGTIGATTHVRSSEMNMAMPLDQAIQNGFATELTLESSVFCPTCGSSVRAQDLIPMGEVTLCPNCRDQYLQSMREGVEITESGFEYASFLLRAGGSIIDGLIMWVIQFAIGMAIGMGAGAVGAQNPGAGDGMAVLYMVLAYGIPLLYATLFLGNPKTQGTLGMMAVRIRIVDKSGGNCSYLKAFGRYFAAILSSLILGIGYLMCIWDKDKQTLHDKIVGTYVVKR